MANPHENPDAEPELRELALVYLAMALGADDDLSYAEREAVTDALHRHAPHRDRAEVQNVVLEVLATHDGQALGAAVLPVIHRLQRRLSEAEKAAILEDLSRIARADGVVLDRERALLAAVAERWRVALPGAAAPPPAAAADAVHHLAFIYLVLAHAPDSAFSPDERHLILSKLRQWAPTLGEEQVEAVLEQALRRYAGGPDPDLLAASITAVKAALPPARRKAALDDLVQIANVDGVFLDSEEDLLNELTAAWDIDAFGDFGASEAEG